MYVVLFSQYLYVLALNIWRCWEFCDLSPLLPEPKINDDFTSVITVSRSEGDEVTFVCLVDGVPTPTIQWQRTIGNEVVFVTPTTRIRIDDVGVLRILNVRKFTHLFCWRKSCTCLLMRLMHCPILQLKPSDEGIYTCDAENSRGNVQQTYRLIIQSKSCLRTTGTVWSSKGDGHKCQRGWHVCIVCTVCVVTMSADMTICQRVYSWGDHVTRNEAVKCFNPMMVIISYNSLVVEATYYRLLLWLLSDLFVMWFKNYTPDKFIVAAWEYHGRLLHLSRTPRDTTCSINSSHWSWWHHLFVLPSGWHAEAWNRVASGQQEGITSKSGCPW